VYRISEHFRLMTVSLSVLRGLYACGTIFSVLIHLTFSVQFVLLPASVASYLLGNFTIPGLVFAVFLYNTFGLPLIH